MAVTSLGDAADASGAKLAAADPIIRKSRDLARTAQRPTTDLAALLTSTKRTKGFERLMDLIYNTTGSVNGFDDAGHFLRTALIATNCVDYSIGWASGCDARFEGAAGKGPPITNFPLITDEGSAGEDATRPQPGAAASPSTPVNRRAATAARWRRRGPQPRARRPRPARRAGGPMRRGGLYSIGSSPVIVGALTVLITIIAVFLAYNATNGLPFVPTYRISVLVPDAAELVPNNEVRIGGIRVGLVKSITPVHLDDGRVVAKLDLVLNQDVDPLPVDSKVLIRNRSALGLKYLEITPGHSRGLCGRRHRAADLGPPAPGRARPGAQRLQPPDPRGGGRRT